MDSLGTLLRPEAPHLPQRGGLVAVCQLFLSAAIHLAAGVAIIASVRFGASSPPQAAIALRQPVPIQITHLVFIGPADLPGGGGGGGGNRQNGPIRRAEAIGHDRVTLRVTKPRASASPPVDAPAVPTLPAVVLDARPLASGTRDVLGLPEGGVAFGTSTGPGSGGGVGDGIGTGIGSGYGPGLGPGSGGGASGGVYRPGGSVTTPRVLRQIKPKYTDDALRQKIQRSVLLEMVVTSAGRTSNIQVVQSLDPSGLDEQAISAAREWEFAPGRLAGAPVDVLVTLIMDFRIQ